jgi:RNA polymerase sigma-70 factor (ECF subfamily)
MQLQEKILILELKRGNAKAFEELYFRYHARLYYFTYKIIRNNQEAEGLVQEVFIAIWENREKLDENKSFSSFVFRIARNKVLNIIKKQLTQKVYRKYILNNDKDWTDLREDIESTEFMDLIQKTIDLLPERTKEIFLLSRNDGMTYIEIAQKLNTTENVVDHEIRKALQKIKEFLNKYYSS